jgi:hypothetical protein
VRVELLHHEGCPAADATEHLARACLAELGLTVVLERRVGPYPSPTLLVDGTDVMGRLEPRAQSEVVCRLDIPTPDRLLIALAAAADRRAPAHRRP